MSCVFHFHSHISRGKMTFLTVPPAVKEVFDKYPLVTYPPVQQLTTDEKNATEKRLYSYSYSPNEPNSLRTSFKLGVYNIYQTQDNTYLSTDPLCLSIELCLSLKNSIKLPKLNNSHDSKKNSLFVISNQSNQNGYLPIFIEEDHKSPHKRIVKDYQSINEIYLSRLEKSSELMLIELVDTVVYDYYITSVLFGLNEGTQSSLYQFKDDSEALEFTNKLSINSVLTALCNRNGFDLRNPNITKSFKSYIRHKKLVKGIEYEKERNKNEFIKNLSILNDLLSDKFFSKEEVPGLLDVKLASYTILINKFFEGHEIYNALQKIPSLVEHGASVVKHCS